MKTTTLAIAAAIATSTLAHAQDADCNVNGIPDAAEIAAGLVDDCNGNGIPDPCEYAGISLSTERSLFGSDHPLVFTVAATRPISDVRLSIAIRADLDAVGEFVQAKVGDTVIETMWITDGEACPAEPQTQTLIVPVATVNAALDANGGDLVVSLQASGATSADDCPDSFASLAIDYVGDLDPADCLGNGAWNGCDIAQGLVSDCNANGYPDECELEPDRYLRADCDGDGVPDSCQIDAAPSLDKNGDGILDECQYARGDFDLDGVVGGSDLAVLLGLWAAPNPPLADLTGDGLVDGADLASLLGNWGEYSGPWGVVMEVEPDPSIVTDPEWRDRIIATGLPWRVVDIGTGIEMLLVPPGTFDMGCSPSNQAGCDSNENPVHEVTLTQAFYLGRYEVTQAQWTAVMGSNPSFFQSPSSEVPAAAIPHRPVDRVSWDMVQAFETETGLRLPTEAEWEYACRAGRHTAFSPNATNDDGLLTQFAWFNQNAASQTRPVGQMQANGLGMHDMHGNLWELVEDWSGSYPSTPQTDPAGPRSGSLKVLRGGGWSATSTGCRASFRFDDAPNFGYFSFGFRAARTP